MRETFEAALAIRREARVGLGVSPGEAEGAVEEVRVRDVARLERQLRGETEVLQNLFRVRPEPLDGPTT